MFSQVGTRTEYCFLGDGADESGWVASGIVIELDDYGQVGVDSYSVA